MKIFAIRGKNKMNLYYTNTEMNIMNSDTGRNRSVVLSQNPPTSILLPEILVLIFKYLPLKDRKNVRLTCSLWSQCSKDKSIAQSEKFVYRSKRSFSDDVTKTVMKCDRISINLEFQDVDISPFSINLWETNGIRVRTLHFLDCSGLDGRMLKIIIEQCVNLSDFRILETYDPWASFFPFIWNKFEESLDYFIHKGITRPQLHTLVAAKSSGSLKNDTISKIISVFPRIKHFGIRRGEEWSLRSTPYIEGFAQYFKISSVYFQKMKPNHSLYPLLQLSLTKLEMSFSIDCKNLASLFNFFRIWKNLNAVSLNVVCPSCSICTSISRLLFHMVNYCPTLRKLKFNCAYSTHLTSEETARFFTSTPNLQCLITDIFFDTQFKHQSLCITNFTLNTLSLNIFDTSLKESRVDFFLLKHCSNIKHLKLHDPSDEILQETFKTRHNLETLIIVQADSCTERGFIGRNQSKVENLSIQKLQKLECLEISTTNWYNFKMKITNELVNEFKFSRLMYLKLGVFLSRKDTDSILRAIMMNMPMLESLMLDKYSPKYLEEIINFCEYGNNLNRLGVHDLPIMFPATMRPLFKACSNLRFVISNRIKRVFVYDPFTEEVSKYRSHYLRFPENDGPFKI